MCRWFAYLSATEPCLLTDVLVDPPGAISKQCSEHYLPRLLPHGDDHDLYHAPDRLLQLRNTLLNMDGLGIAWYTAAAQDFVRGTSGLRPALYKSPSPPINDFNFRSLCSNTQTTCLFAHIRASSGATVAHVNSHPFVFGRHAFMHNGVVNKFSAIRRELCDTLAYQPYCNVLGSTDSEHAAALYMTYLTSHGDRDAWEQSYSLSAMRDAMLKTVVAILQLQRKTLGDKFAPSSLNFCATDGSKLIAIRFRNHASQQPPSLYYSLTAGRTLNRKYPGDPHVRNGAQAANAQATHAAERHGSHVIVASEPTTFDEDEWTLMHRNHFLLVDSDNHTTQEAVSYDPALNAEDPDFPSKPEPAPDSSPESWILAP